MSHENSPSFSEEEEEEVYESNRNPAGDISGTLSKWTNYIHGWQDRFIVLKDGTLSYYKCESELTFGCRGAISIHKAAIKPHEFDELRFDVSVNDCMWYLRCVTSEDKTRWVEGLERYKQESGYGSQTSLKRHGSAVSISSTTLSTTSASSVLKDRGLKVKVAELETYRDILIQQIDTLQKYFDVCSLGSVPQEDSTTFPALFSDDLDTPTPTAPENDNPFFNSVKSDKKLSEACSHTGLRIVDFRGEALTFKATTSAILSSLSNCIDIMSQREEVWRKRTTKEIEKRKKLEEYFKQALKEAKESKKTVVMGGPDCEEGPHSALKEDEFYDAVELGLERLEAEQDFRDRLKSIAPISAPESEARMHPLWPEIERVSLEQLHYARLGVGEGAWELFAEDGEMRMYRREEELNGNVVDPLKAVHTVRGVTGHEMCHYFFDPDVRLEWETTVEQVTVLENISDDTKVFLQIHKRIWPSTQRDSLFWSHKRHVPDPQDPDAQKIWIVCNHSTEHVNAPESTNGKFIRVFLTVIMVCQTVVNPPMDASKITRDNLQCKITYCSVAPPSVLRAVYKREYPRFLKKFTKYVIDRCKDKPIMF
ncbi:Collagen type IV alpha-3-binding protein [Folsomia candida]|uniref:Ceramide transfer protein n=1 Tax=Folsomia candida TaxID=158441 RepID=A0A226F0T4_FOLCA|nr:Collagen type IV alpha-3-binding protein [Folsomia candida]